MRRVFAVGFGQGSKKEIEIQIAIGIGSRSGANSQPIHSRAVRLTSFGRDESSFGSEQAATRLKSKSTSPLRGCGNTGSAITSQRRSIELPSKERVVSPASAIFF